MIIGFKNQQNLWIAKAFNENIHVHLCTVYVKFLVHRKVHVSSRTNERNIANDNFPLSIHFTCTYTIRWYPGGVCSPFVLLINTISQTALVAVLLD